MWLENAVRFQFFYNYLGLFYCGLTYDPENIPFALEKNANGLFPKECWLCLTGLCFSNHEVHESRQIGSGQTGDGKSECRHSRNQRTKMDWNG